MKRTVSILLLAIYISSSTVSAQVMMIPLLFEHFNEHKAENQALSFTSFIKMHYFSKQDHQDPDRETDQKLPFKTAITSVVNMDLSQPAVFEFKPITYFPNIHLSFSPYIENFIPNATINSIWQPPQA